MIIITIIIIIIIIVTKVLIITIINAIRVIIIIIIIIITWCATISESPRPLSTQLRVVSSSLFPTPASLIYPHRRVFVSLYFFVLALVPRVLLGLLELLLNSMLFTI